MPDVHLRVFRGSPATQGGFADFDVPVEEGMVVLDALHWIQAHAAPDLAIRWNCKAAKCGSCSAEVNGRPRLTCKTRLSDFPPASRSPSSRCGRSRSSATSSPTCPGTTRSTPDPAVHSRRPTCPRRSGAGSRRTSSGSRSSASASSASCARTSATSCATTRSSSRSWARASSSGRRGSRCTRWTRPTARVPQGRRRHRLLQHHEVLHRGLPGAHQDHRQRDHPAQGAGRGRVLRPVPGRLAQAPRRRRGGSRRELPVPDVGAAERDAAGRRRRARRRAPAQPAMRVRLVIRTDGAARGNPGPASPARSSSTRRGPMRSTRWRRPTPRSPRRSGVQTNNVAEWTGVVRALELARELGRGEVDLLLDSKLIVEQLHGRWRVKDAKLLPLWAAARASWAASGAGRRARAPRPQLGGRRARERGDRPGRRPAARPSVVRGPGTLTRPCAVRRREPSLRCRRLSPADARSRRARRRACGVTRPPAGRHPRLASWPRRPLARRRRRATGAHLGDAEVRASTGSISRRRLASISRPAPSDPTDLATTPSPSVVAA